MSEARYFVVTADSRPTPITAPAFRTPEQQALPW
jgi:hypothetical protein